MAKSSVVNEEKPEKEKLGKKLLKGTENTTGFLGGGLSIASSSMDLAGGKVSSKVKGGVDAISGLNDTVNSIAGILSAGKEIGEAKSGLEKGKGVIDILGGLAGATGGIANTVAGIQTATEKNSAAAEKVGNQTATEKNSAAENVGNIAGIASGGLGVISAGMGLWQASHLEKEESDDDFKNRKKQGIFDSVIGGLGSLAGIGGGIAGLIGGATGKKVKAGLGIVSGLLGMAGSLSDVFFGKKEKTNAETTQETTTDSTVGTTENPTSDTTAGTTATTSEKPQDSDQ